MDHRTLSYPRSWIAAALLAIVLVCPGCVMVHVENPLFAASSEEIDADWKRMRSNPVVEPARPLVVLGGWS